MAVEAPLGERLKTPDRSVGTSNVLVVCLRSPDGFLTREVPPDDRYSPGAIDLVSGIVPEEAVFYDPLALSIRGESLLVSLGTEGIRPSKEPIGIARKIARYNVRANEDDSCVTEEIRDTRRVFLGATTDQSIPAPEGFSWTQPFSTTADRWRHRSVPRALEVMQAHALVSRFTDTTTEPFRDPALQAYEIRNPWNWFTEVQQRQHAR